MKSTTTDTFMPLKILFIQSSDHLRFLAKHLSTKNTNLLWVSSWIPAEIATTDTHLIRIKTLWSLTQKTSMSKTFKNTKTLSKSKSTWSAHPTVGTSPPSRASNWGRRNPTLPGFSPTRRPTILMIRRHQPSKKLSSTIHIISKTCSKISRP